MNTQGTARSALVPGMRLLVLGRCATAHALAWKCARSSLVDEVLVAPGNGGTVFEKGVRNIPFDSIAQLVESASQEKITIAIAADTDAITEGITEALQEAGIQVFSPSGSAARLETDMDFRGNMLRAAGVAIPRSETFKSQEAAASWFRNLPSPPMLSFSPQTDHSKLYICKSFDETEEFIAKHFKENSKSEVRCTERIEGVEMDVTAIVDDLALLPLPLTISYREREEGAELGIERTIMEGGMGGYSPPQFAESVNEQALCSRILAPIAAEMRRQGHPLRGFLHVRVVIHKDGTPFVSALRVTLDPASAPLLLLRLNSDLVPVIVHACSGRLHDHKLTFRRHSAVSLVLVSKKPKEKEVIRGISLTTGNIPEPNTESETKMFHMGTRVIDQREIETTGEQVLMLCVMGKDVAEVRDHTYAAVKSIDFPSCWYRSDIASSLVEVHG